MVDEIELDLFEELKDLEFAKSYGAESAKSEIGLALFRARQKTNLTQKELAEKLGVKQPYIAQIESGEANLTFEAVGRMLAVLGLKMKIVTDSLVPQEDAPGQAGRNALPKEHKTNELAVRETKLPWNETKPKKRKGRR